MSKKQLLTRQVGYGLTVSGWEIGEKWGKYRQWVARPLLALLYLFTPERASVNGAPTEPHGVTESLWSPLGHTLGPPRDHHARPVVRREIDTAADRRGPAPSRARQAGLGEQRAQYDLHLV